MRNLIKLSPIVLLSLLLSCTSVRNETIIEQNFKQLSEQQLYAYHDSGRYKQELTDTLQEAQNFVVNKAQYYHRHNQNKLALVLDIDETSLSNYSNMAKYHFKPTMKQIHSYEFQAKAPSIQPTLDLYKVALKNGVDVFFVTGRHNNERQATIRNLHRAGYKKWTKVFFRPAADAAPTAVPYKSGVRAKLEKRGYKVIATVGDQYSDIKGGHADKGFKLPNPYYLIP